jgi:hypothetical protein
MEEICLLRGPCRDVISKGQSSSVRSVLYEKLCKEDLVGAVEESPELEAVARERLVKIQLAGKGLAGAVGIVNCGDYQWRCNCL